MTTTPIAKIKGLDERSFATLCDEFFDFCLCHGNMMKIHTDPVKEKFKGHTSSTTIVPSVFSKIAYEKALEIQVLFNKLYHSIAMDKEFLVTTLKSLSASDDFMQRCLELYLSLDEKNFKESIHLGLMRSDYMCHLDTETIKQVELNTMSAAASSVNRAATEWHRYATGTLLKLDNSHIPKNSATQMLAQAMVTAWELYGKSSAAIVYFVGEAEFNFADQRFLQYDIHGINPNIRVVRVTLPNLRTEMRISDDGAMLVGDTEVAVFYYRYGYSPSHYTEKNMHGMTTPIVYDYASYTNVACSRASNANLFVSNHVLSFTICLQAVVRADWDIRLAIERSRAVKCPSIAYVLAGTKRVQQILTEDRVLDRWLDSESASKIRQTFVNMYSFEGEKSSDVISLAQKDPEKFVLKPQRDGGGNNFHGQDIVDQLNRSTTQELSAYTLMEKIRPPKQENVIMNTAGPYTPVQILSELGIFGAILVDREGKEIMNSGAGFLFRSKPDSALEGDLMRGTSSLDSLWLI